MYIYIYIYIIPFILHRYTLFYKNTVYNNQQVQISQILRMD